jgi:hypothetical protein
MPLVTVADSGPPAFATPLVDVPEGGPPAFPMPLATSAADDTPAPFPPRLAAVADVPPAAVVLIFADTHGAGGADEDFAALLRPRTEEAALRLAVGLLVVHAADRAYVAQLILRLEDAELLRPLLERMGQRPAVIAALRQLSATGAVRPPDEDCIGASPDDAHPLAQPAAPPDLRPAGPPSPDDELAAAPSAEPYSWPRKSNRFV